MLFPETKNNKELENLLISLYSKQEEEIRQTKRTFLLSGCFLLKKVRYFLSYRRIILL